MRKGKGRESIFGKETIRDIFDKVQRYTHEKEPGRKGESKEKENLGKAQKESHV
jgi:hypothetical protein